jgi:hypothetical protein
MTGRLSLTKRVLAWHMIAVPALVLLLVLTSHRIMTVNIQRASDDALLARAQAVQALILEQVPQPLDSPDLLLAILRNQNLPAFVAFVRVVSLTGDQLAGTGVIPERVRATLEAGLPPNAEPPRMASITTVKTASGESLRVYTAPVSRSAIDPTVVYLQVGDNLTTARSTVPLLTYLLVEAVVGSVLVIVVGTLIVKTGIARLPRVVGRAPEPFGRRPQ